MRKSKALLLMITAFFAGSIMALSTTFALAHGGDISLIHACVRNNNGNIRIVSANTNCNGNESPLDWNIQGIQGPPGAPGPTGVPGSGSSNGLPFMCSNCDLSLHADKFAGKDFSKAQIYSGSFENANISGVIFKEAVLAFVSFSNANLTGADLSDLQGSFSLTNSNPDFPNANLTNANISNNTFTGGMNPINFANTNLQNTNFSNAVFNKVTFLGAQNMDTANLTGVTWDNVTCPDGTNSDNNGNTCVGHLTP